MKKIFLTFMVLSVFPLLTKAAPVVQCGPNTSKPQCGICDLFGVIVRIVSFIMVNLVPALAAILLVVTGFQLFVTASGKPEEMDKAKKSMKNIVIGLALIYGAWIIVNTIMSVSGLVAWEGLRGGGWNVLCN
jgi:hypothetical protein